MGDIYSFKHKTKREWGHGSIVHFWNKRKKRHRTQNVDLVMSLKWPIYHVFWLETRRTTTQYWNPDYLFRYISQEHCITGETWHLFCIHDRTTLDLFLPPAPLHGLFCFPDTNRQSFRQSSLFSTGTEHGPAFQLSPCIVHGPQSVMPYCRKRLEAVRRRTASFIVKTYAGNPAVREKVYPHLYGPGW